MADLNNGTLQHLPTDALPASPASYIELANDVLQRPEVTEVSLENLIALQIDVKKAMALAVATYGGQDQWDPTA